MNSTKIVVMAIMLIFSGLASADKHEMPVVKTSEDLNRMKELVGTWKGVSSDDEKSEIVVDYKLSSGGTVVVETISPGTTHEMTTVYYDEGGKLAMAHYCMLGNHPILHLIKSSDSELDFDAGKGTLEDQMHMHTLDITFSGKNEMTQRWVALEKGKESHVTTFKLKR